MKALLFAPLLALSLLPQKCNTPPAPPPSDVKSAPQLAAAGAEQLGEISAGVAAAREFNTQNAPGVARDQTEAVLSVVASHLAPPSPARVNHFREIAAKAFAGKPDEAEAEWAAERALGSARLARIAELEKQVAREREAAALELQRQLSAAQQAADARERLLLMCLFFGFGALLVAGGVIIGMLGAKVPIFGPRAGVGIAAAGVVLIGLGTLLRFVERLMDRHPFIFWGGILAAVLCAIVSAALIYANHRHSEPDLPLTA